MNEIEKHISIIERTMFAFATSTVDKKPIFPTLKYCKEALQEKTRTGESAPPNFGTVAEDERTGCILCGCQGERKVGVSPCGK